MGSKVRKLVLGFFCFLLFLRPYSSTDTLEQGQEIKDGAELVSAGGHFRLGFLNITSNNYYLGIWNNDDGARLGNSVWIANRDTPIFNNSGSLTIDGNGSLKISHNGGLPIVLYSGQEATNISAVLLDSGTFVVHELSSEGLVKRELWQSFDYPTDTVLPGMKLGVNRKTGHTLSLTSWRSDVLPDTGSFTFGLHPNHSNQLAILWRGDIYWDSGPLYNRNFNASALGQSFSFLKFSYVSNENETYFNISSEYGTTSVPQMRITGRGVLTTEGNVLAVECNYNLDTTDKRCVAQEIPECRRSAYFSQYYFDPTLTKDGFKFNEGENLTIVDCEAKCFNNCSCVAYASTNQDFQTGCQIWSTRPSTARNYSEGDMYHVNVIYLLEVQAEYAIEETYKPVKKRWWIWLIVTVGGIVITLLCLLSYAKVKKFIAEEERKKKQEMLIIELGGNAIPSTIRDKLKKQGKDGQDGHELQIFSLESISVATSNFSTENKLGEGGFGPVYKGKLPDGQEIAIKRLSRSSGQALVEFKNETILIAKLQHTNLVRLLGFCIEEEEKILLYEYMPNKSLDFFLFDSTKKYLLNWKKRLCIIEGIAQGLIYLHKYSRLRVIHRDLKASNILLDEEMNPKISDFGMARIFGLHKSEENTNRVVGTYDYMSPEHAMSGIVSIKTDVFSFGVLLLEIVSGKKNNNRYHSDYPLNLIEYAWQLWNEGKGLELTDPILLDESCPPFEVLRCIHVGLLCVQDQAIDRPTMLDVALMLSNETLQLSPPKQPAFFINSSVEKLGDSEIKPEICSLNNVTISVMEAR